MAETMSKSDLYIGAAGTTSWERCCLGLPTISFAISDNQVDVLDKLEKHACTITSNLDQICFDLDNFLSKDQSKLLKSLSSNSASISDGKCI